MITETGKNYQTLQLKSEQEKTLSVARRRYGFLAQCLFLFMDIFYGKERRLSKFKVLEVIARVPYQSWEHVAYIAMTHTYTMPHFARRIFEFIKESRQQQDNEQWHLLILEEMIQAANIRENFFLFMVLPQIAAFIYYHISWLLYVIRPSWSYNLNADFEDHAEHEYMEFVKENPDFESEPFESDFKDDYGNFVSEADLFRRIGLDERLHKEESLNRVEHARFSTDDFAHANRGGDWVVTQSILLICLVFTPDFFACWFFDILQNSRGIAVFRWIGIRHSECHLSWPQRNAVSHACSPQSFDSIRALPHRAPSGLFQRLPFFYRMGILE